MITPPLQHFPNAGHRRNSLLFLFGTALGWVLALLPFAVVLIFGGNS